MPANPLDKLLKPRFPPCAVGVDSGAAAAVQLERARGGFLVKRAASINLPALYYALKRNADFDPDPQTGQNRQISSAYQIEAVRAFVVPSSNRTAQADSDSTKAR